MIVQKPDRGGTGLGTLTSRSQRAEAESPLSTMRSGFYLSYDFPIPFLRVT